MSAVRPAGRPAVTLGLLAVGVLAATAPLATASTCSMSPGANCSGMNMPKMVGGMSMAGANMSGSDMRNADMRGMNMSHANFTGADLRGAKMSGAKMDGINLTGANMTGVVMKNVMMRKARMSKTKMRNMRLTKVNMPGAVISDVDLRGSRFVGGGMPGAMIVRSRFGPAPSKKPRENQYSCLSGGPGYYGSNIGYPWQSYYNLTDAVFKDSNLHCATFSYVNSLRLSFINSDVSNGHFYGEQPNSQTIVAVKTSFAYAGFSEYFWSPAYAKQVNLTGASCSNLVNGDQSNRVWGRFNYISPYSVSGGWKYGIVTSTAFGNIQYQSQPLPVVQSAAQHQLAVDANPSRPYLTLNGSYNCPGQPAPDWLGGGY